MNLRVPCFRASGASRRATGKFRCHRGGVAPRWGCSPREATSFFCTRPRFVQVCAYPSLHRELCVHFLAPGNMLLYRTTNKTGRLTDVCERLWPHVWPPLIYISRIRVVVGTQCVRRRAEGESPGPAKPCTETDPLRFPLGGGLSFKFVVFSFDRRIKTEQERAMYTFLSPTEMRSCRMRLA